jgi:CubicO group peptidase (beta-lactamase class C family)
MNVHVRKDRPSSSALLLSIATSYSAHSQALGSAGAYRWAGAAGTHFWVDPREEVIGILMPQLEWDPHPTARQLEVLTYQAIVD